MRRALRRALTGAASTVDMRGVGAPSGAVSYTHLDVYKRQRVARPGAVITALMPSPDFSADRARGIARDYGLGYLDQAMLETWARAARKTTPEQVVSWFMDAGLSDCTIQPLMAGSFLAAVARVGP